MISKKDFITEVEQNFDFSVLSEEAQEYWAIFKTDRKKDKPKFTDNGRLILGYLQKDNDNVTWRSSDIAEGLFISSRTVSGAIRKLVTDGYVEKVSTDPVVYALTENGKNVNLDEEN